MSPFFCKRTVQIWNHVLVCARCIIGKVGRMNMPVYLLELRWCFIWHWTHCCNGSTNLGQALFLLRGKHICKLCVWKTVKSGRCLVTRVHRISPQIVVYLSSPPSQDSTTNLTFDCGFHLGDRRKTFPSCSKPFCFLVCKHAHSHGPNNTRRKSRTDKTTKFRQGEAIISTALRVLGSLFCYWRMHICYLYLRINK